MNGRTLFEAIGYVDDQYLDMVDAPEKENLEMNTDKKRAVTRKSITFLIAAAICVSVLTMTAMAAGWIPGFFNTLKEKFPQDAELFDAAAQANIDAVPEIMEIPHLDLSQFVLLEDYFDGETILIGYNLDIILPSPAVGIEPNNELLKEIKNSTKITSTSWSGSEKWLAEPTTENAVKHNLAINAAEMDRMLKGTLSESDYQRAWEWMNTHGYVCIAVQNAWLGDHILINGVDTVEAYQASNAYADRTEYTTEWGNCIRLEPLPEDVQNQEKVTVTLDVRSSVNYWYMSMDGEGRIYYDTSNMTSDQISFELEKVR